MLLGAGAVRWAEPGFWVPAVVALPFLAVEGWYEVRSRGRRLVPELAGGVGVCSVAAMIVLADGQSSRLAFGVWLVLAARVATSIPHVRAQIARLHGRPPQARAASAGDLAALGLAGTAVGLDGGLAAGAAAVLVLMALQRLAGGRPVPRAVILGMRQSALGLGVVLVTAIGVLASAS